MVETIERAAQRLADAESQFSLIEAAYFSGTASLDELKQAWQEREAARRALAEAHWATSRRPHGGNQP